MTARALDSLEFECRWVGWRNEPRADDPAKLTKVPYSPHTGAKAEANDPRTWNTRSAAEAWARQHVNGMGGGIGIELGDLGDGTALGGLDLDTCRTEDGRFEEWAVEVIRRFGSYCEVSPTGTGAKIFFHYKTDDLPRLLAAMDGAKTGKQFKRANGADHPPGIEVYLTGRFFATTEQRLNWTPDRLADVTPETILWLLEYGRTFAGAAKAKSGGHDNSRSAAAFR